MESKDLRHALHEAERGEAATWIDYPPTPRWWAPMFGVWSAVLTLTVGLLDGLASAFGNLVLVACMGVVIGWQRRYRGTYPQGHAPREFSPAFAVLFGGALVVALLGWLVTVMVSVWLAAVLVAAATWSLVAWYERAYARISEQVRARLA